MKPRIFQWLDEYDGTAYGIMAMNETESARRLFYLVRLVYCHYIYTTDLVWHYNDNIGVIKDF